MHSDESLEHAAGCHQLWCQVEIEADYAQYCVEDISSENLLAGRNFSRRPLRQIRIRYRLPGFDCLHQGRSILPQVVRSKAADTLQVRCLGGRTAGEFQ